MSNFGIKSKAQTVNGPIKKKEIGYLRKRAEEAVQKQEQELKQFMDTAESAAECLRNSVV